MVNYIKVYTKDIRCENGVWVDEFGTPLNGIKKSFYGGGELQDETQMTDGVPNGIQKVYDPKGNLWWENTWKNNVLIKYKKF